MNYFCDSGGEIFHVDTERVFQGSANANVINFFGAFPYNAEVLIAYELPDKTWTTPQRMTPIAQLSNVKDDEGNSYAGWQTRIGARLRVENGVPVRDENDNLVYDLDYTITQDYGTVGVQFFVYANGGNGLGAQITSARSSFTVEKGVPIVLPDTPTDDYEALLAQILAAISDKNLQIDTLESGLSQISQNVQTNTEAIQSLEAEKGQPNGVATLGADGKVPSDQLPVDVNIENGTGKSSVQQLPDGVKDGFDFTGKNPNATALDDTLTGIIPYGATGDFASSFGGKSAAMGKRSHAEGTTTIAKGGYSHAEGDNSVALGADSHVEGYQTVTGPSANASHAEGYGTQTLGTAAHAEGEYTEAKANAAHAEGYLTLATGFTSHAEGELTESNGYASHAEGAYAVANGQYSHAESYRTIADGDNSHAEGAKTHAIGEHSHTEGAETVAYEESAHAEGYSTHARGKISHTEGAYTEAIGMSSHAEGIGTVAGYDYQHVEGTFNDNKADSLFEIGNGTDDNNRSNAFEATKDGRAKVYGEPKEPEDVVRLKELGTMDGKIAELVARVEALEKK